MCLSAFCSLCKHGHPSPIFLISLSLLSTLLFLYISSFCIYCLLYSLHTLMPYHPSPSSPTPNLSPPPSPHSFLPSFTVSRLMLNFNHSIFTSSPSPPSLSPSFLTRPPLLLTCPDKCSSSPGSDRYETPWAPNPTTSSGFQPIDFIIKVHKNKTRETGLK